MAGERGFPLKQMVPSKSKMKCMGGLLRIFDIIYRISNNFPFT